MAITTPARARARNTRTTRRRSKTVREALNDWRELVELEADLAGLAAAEAAFSQRLLQQYAVEAAAAGDAPAARLLAAMGRTHQRAERQLKDALTIATPDRRTRPRRAAAQTRRQPMITAVAPLVSLDLPDQAGMEDLPPVSFDADRLSAALADLDFYLDGLLQGFTPPVMDPWTADELPDVRLASL